MEREVVVFLLALAGMPFVPLMLITFSNIYFGWPSLRPMEEALDRFVQRPLWERFFIIVFALGFMISEQIGEYRRYADEPEGGEKGKNVRRKPRRLTGPVIISAIFWTVMSLASAVVSNVTLEDKEQRRAYEAARQEEFAALGRILLPDPNYVSKSATNAPPQRSSGQTIANSVPGWDHGVYHQGARVVFPDGWSFPHGSNHLSAVEVMAWGEIFPDGYSSACIASLGTRITMASDVSTFRHGLTPSNTYAFVWTAAHEGRINGEPIDGRIEFFRNGDISITTNGVVETIPRELPFPHDGYGQDAEWVEANFTNSTEIAAAGGYAAWVDEQVGTGLTNGLYKLTVSVAEDPPETTQLSVGEYSVAVTNAGEYVFLLGKGISYPISVCPQDATNFVYSAVDDVQASRAAPLRLRGGSSGRWSTGSGTLEIAVPMFPMVPGAESAYIVWSPTLGVSPGTWQPTPYNATKTFTATLTDVPWFMPTPAFAWSSLGAAPVSVSAPASVSTTMSCAFPGSYGKYVQLLLGVDIGPVHLVSTFSALVEDFDEGDSESQYLYDENPFLIVDASPEVVFFEKSVGNTSSAGFACRYNVEGAGTFSLNMSNGECLVRDSSLNVVNNGYTWRVEGAGSGVKHFSAYIPCRSSSPDGTVFTVTFTPDDEGSSMADSAGVVFVEWETETKATWPNDRRRKTVGVCEVVNITFNPRMPNLSLTSSSQGSSLQMIGYGLWKYTAPEHQSLDEIIAPEFGSIFQFNVLAPTGYISKLKTIEVTTNNVPGVSGGYAMLFDLVVLPTNVSFYAIKIQEVGMSAVNVTGYFAEPRNSQYLVHSTAAGANSWSTVYRGNKCSDRAQMAELSPPWGSGGGMTWPIPNVYTGHPANPSGIHFCNTDQTFAVDLTGTARLEKFGWFAEVATNRVFSYGRTTTP